MLRTIEKLMLFHEVSYGSDKNLAPDIEERVETTSYQNPKVTTGDGSGR